MPHPLPCDACKGGGKHRMSTAFAVLVLLVGAIFVVQLATAHKGQVRMRNRRAVEEAMSLNAFR